ELDPPASSLCSPSSRRQTSLPSLGRCNGSNSAFEVTPKPWSERTGPSGLALSARLSPRPTPALPRPKKSARAEGCWHTLGAVASLRCMATPSPHIDPGTTGTANEQGDLQAVLQVLCRIASVNNQPTLGWISLIRDTRRNHMARRILNRK